MKHIHALTIGGWKWLIFKDKKNTQDLETQSLFKKQQQQKQTTDTSLFKVKSCEQPAKSSEVFSLSKNKVEVCVFVYGRDGGGWIGEMLQFKTQTLITLLNIDF